VPNSSSYRGRIAPSPTGLMHLGHARTFWIAYQRAFAAPGTLVFRNEDLDPQRSRPDFAAAMVEDLRWLGIRWQEGPDIGGSFAPYQQSQRRDHYLAAWQTLANRGFLYPCHCSRKDLARMAQAPHEDSGNAAQDDDEPIYPGTCRPAIDHVLPSVGRLDGQSWRFRVPEGEVIEFLDQNLGPKRYVAGRDFGDFLVSRRDGVPSYQLAVVVDDAAMGITEVVRGADLLKSTARQILLYRAFGLPEPTWYHCALVTDQTGQRLAKRHDALSLRSMREARMTPQQVLAMF
jgi:glutamyl/glutaminyl-tRNA synthetase